VAYGGNTGSNLDLSQLDSALSGEGINSSLISSINSYLIGLGDTTGLHDTTDTISVQAGTPPFTVAEVLNVTSAGTFTIHTADGEQLVVVQDASTDVRIEGHTSVLAVTGDGAGDKISADARFDTLLSGDGNGDELRTTGESSSLKAGSGNNDTITSGGSSLDTLVAGSGNDDSLSAGPGNEDDLRGGIRTGDTLDGGNGDRVNMYAGSGSHQLLEAGHGQSDWLKGGSGSHLTMTASGAEATLLTGSANHESIDGSGHNDSIYAGGASDPGAGGSGNGSGTLAGGDHAQFHIGAHGSDTITGSGSGDKVFFDSQAYGSGSGVSITTHGSVTTVQFTDTSQSFKIQGVSTLQFSDGHVIHI